MVVLDGRLPGHARHDHLPATTPAAMGIGADLTDSDDDIGFDDSSIEPDSIATRGIPDKRKLIVVGRKMLDVTPNAINQARTNLFVSVAVRVGAAGVNEGNVLIAHPGSIEIVQNDVPKAVARAKHEVSHAVTGQESNLGAWPDQISERRSTDRLIHRPKQRCRRI